MVLFVLLLLFVAVSIYQAIYFNSKRFLSIKAKIKSYTDDCNELNAHIEYLKSTHFGSNQLEQGEATFTDSSRYKYKRKALKNKAYGANVYNCTRQVCSNASQQPFKYVCKYFNISATEENLSKFEEMLNNYEAAEAGKTLLQNKKKDIINSVSNETPFIIRKLYGKKLEKKLGFHEVDLSTTYFPKYTFNYVSSGGNSSMRYDVIMDINNLNRFVNFLSEKVKFNKSAAGQRALMTSTLRKKILKRDNYTCNYCGISTKDEPHLLLEVDHIIPISKGGLTSEGNLQTLCWRCNRSKGTKVNTSINNATTTMQEPAIE